jgi:hypothetical protein
MKVAFILFTILVAQLSNRTYNLVNTAWEYKIAIGCVNTYKFRSEKIVDEYDCELNYTFKCTYRISKDTLIIIEKDDSHSEDNNKITYYRMKYQIMKDALLGISNEELVKGKWMDKTFKTGSKTGYRRISTRLR